MTKKNGQKEKNAVDKTQHRKQKIKQHEYQKLGMTFRFWKKHLKIPKR